MVKLRNLIQYSKREMIVLSDNLIELETTYRFALMKLKQQIKRIKNKEKFK